MREYTPPDGTVTVVSPKPITAKLNGIPVELGPYTQIAVHPANVPEAFKDTPVEQALPPARPPAPSGSYQDRALQIAREAAIRHRDEHEYISRNVDDFLPHQWVIDAIVMALKEH